MKIVKIKGGIGNQLFQYCFAYLIGKQTGKAVRLDMSAYENSIEDSIRVPRLLKLKISLPVASRADINKVCYFRHGGNTQTNIYRGKILAEILLNKRYFFERNRAYIDPGSIADYDYYDGYWQSWRYVSDVWEEIKSELSPQKELSCATQKMIDEVSAENSVFIGIRRGDYKNAKKHYGSFGNEYFQKAISYINNRIEDPTFYVFSDDISWVKENIDLAGQNVVYREKTDVIDDLEELFIMAACKHSIISNSTFHGWGAWLNDNGGKIVVAPSTWFFDNKPIDIVPPHWIKI